MKKGLLRLLSLVLTVMMLVSAVGVSGLSVFAAGSPLDNVDHISASLDEDFIYPETYGYWDYEHGFYRYDLPSSVGYSITVTYEDGNFDTYYDVSSLNNLFDLWSTEDLAVITDDQSAENPWGVGTHAYVLKVAGFEVPMEFEIIEAPFDYFVAKFDYPRDYTGTELTYKENTYGGYQYNFDGEYWSYELPRYELEFYNEDGSLVWVDNAPSFTVDNQNVEPWGVGEHQMQIRCMGKTRDINITIEPYSVENVEVELVNPYISQYTNGDWRWSDNAGDFYHYYLPEIGKITVDRGDGVMEEYVPGTDEYLSMFYYVNYGDDQYESPWELGEHSFECQLLGLRVDVPVEIVETNIIDIQLTFPSGNEFVEGTHGYERDGVWIYHLPDFVAEITYINGVTQECTLGYIWETMDANIYHNQEEEPWGVGEHSFELCVNNFQTEIPVVIIEDPIEGFELVYDESDTEVVKGTGGWNQDGWYYYREPSFQVQVNYKDGTYELVSRWDFYEKLGINISVHDDQSRENPWDVGEHAFEVTIGDSVYYIPFTIVNTDIADVKITLHRSNEYIEGTNGYENHNGDWIYNWPAFKAVVTKVDGTSKIYENPYQLSQDYDYSVYSDQDENPWGLGEHSFRLSFGGYETEIPVKIVENPYESFELIYETKYIAQGTEGYDAGGYFRYHWPYFELKVNYKGGTSEVVKNGEIRDKLGLDFYIDDNQSPENPWGLGEHGFDLTIGEYNFYMPVVIVAGTYSYEVRNGEAWITDYRGTLTHDHGILEIPDEIEGYPVVGISGFYNATNFDEITRIVVPDSVKYLSSWTFDYFSNLVDLTLGKGILNIGPGSFFGCRNLKNIFIDNDYYKDIDGVVYDRALSLINYPNGRERYYLVPEGVYDVENLPHNVVADFGGRTQYVTVDGITYTGDMKKIISCVDTYEGEYKMLESVMKIADGAFKDCDRLTSVVVSPLVTKISYEAFYGCDSLVAVDIPDSVKVIDMFAFEECVSLTDVSIGSGLELIDYEAFKNCNSLEKIVLPNNENLTIQYEAFYGCDKLSDVTFPEKFEYLGSRAFASCGFTELEYPCAEFFGENVFANNRRLTKVVAEKFYSDEYAAITWGTFDECSALYDVTLGDVICEIGDYAFRGCAIKTIDLPDNLMYLGSFAFANCYNLESIVIPMGVERVYGGTFMNTASLKSCHFMNPDVSFGPVDETDRGGVFEGSGLEKIQIGARTEKIACYMFKDTLIEHADVQESVTSLMYGAFMNCDYLTKVTLPEGLESIESRVFMDTPLTTIEIPSTVTYIGEDVFTLCENMESVTVAEGNEVYYSIDGVLYERSALKYYPANRWGELYIGSKIDLIYRDALEDASHISRFVVDPENTSYKVISGGLFTADGTSLLRYPGGKYGTAYIPETTVDINLLYSWWENTEFSDAFTGCSGITDIVVSPDNPEYASYDGVLYNKNMTELLRCPEGRVEPITIPAQCSSISENAFNNCSKLTGIYCEDGNEIYEAFDGVLYEYYISESAYAPYSLRAARGHTMIYCPAGIEGEITIPATCTGIEHGVLDGCEKITAFNVEEGNSLYTSVDGILYFGKHAIACPETKTETVTDEETGVKIELSGKDTLVGFDLKVSAVDDAKLEEIIAGKLTDSKDISLFAVTDARFEQISFNSKVEITVPLAEGLDPRTAVVYKVENNGAIKPVKSSYSNGNITFEIDTLGTYALAAGDVPEIVRGDYNGDGTVNLKDALIARKYVMNNLASNVTIYEEADFDGDGVITLKDVIRVRRSMYSVITG